MDAPFVTLMRALLDTNVLVRHLTGDPPAQARRATAFLGDDHELVLADLVLAELVYALGSVYRQPRATVAVACRALLAMPSITADHDVLLRALELFETVPLDFAESYLVALGEIEGVDAIASFDRALDKVRTMRRIEP